MKKLALLLTFAACAENWPPAEPYQEDGWTYREVSPGIVLEQLVDTDSMTKAHVLRISGRRVSLVSAGGSCATIPDLGSEAGATAGVNWSFAGPWPRPLFGPDSNTCTPFALTKIDDKVLDPEHTQNRYQKLLTKETEMTVGFGAVGEYAMKELAADDDWEEMPGAAAGWPTLLPYSDDNLPAGKAFTDKREPRTAAGLTAEGELLLVVVDGRRAQAVGMTLPELADFMEELGAVIAVNGDGGGSSTMWVDGEVVNQPSGLLSQPRAVADGIFVF